MQLFGMERSRGYLCLNETIIWSIYQRIFVTLISGNQSFENLNINVKKWA